MEDKDILINISEESKETKSRIDICSDIVIESFYETDKDSDSFALAAHDETVTSLDDIISEKLITLLSSSCFDIDVVEVDTDKTTVYIFIDGEDSALLIGKVGYRYNALHYMISQWIQKKYDKCIKLEIARFVTEQRDNLAETLKPVIEHIEQLGWGKTRPLDGVLVELALEYLRSKFPNKYVAVKKRQDGKKYVLINKFNDK